MESTESRFAHLLQPIRELTKNWDIDVASELNDYLEEASPSSGVHPQVSILRHLRPQVSILRHLRPQVSVLRHLRPQVSVLRCPSSGISVLSVRPQASPSSGVRPQFTPLDLDTSEDSQQTDYTTSSSVTPLHPESLIPPETTEKNKLPLISLKDFRFNIFIPGDEDLIMLGSAAARLLSDKLSVEVSLQQNDGAARPDADVGNNGGEAADHFLPLEDNNMELDQNPEEHVHQNLKEHVDRHQAPNEGQLIRERRQVVEDKLRRKEETPPPVNVWALHDPYAVLGEDKPLKPGKCYRVPDGLDDGGKRKRKRATSLQDFRSWFRGTCENRPSLKINERLVSELNYIYLTTMRRKLSTRKKIYRREVRPFVMMSQGVVSDVTVMYCVMSQGVVSDVTVMYCVMSQGVVVSDEELWQTLLQPEEVEPQQQEEEPVDGFRHPDLLGGDDENSDNEHEAFPDDIPAEFVGGPDFMSPDVQRDELSYEDLVKLRVVSVSCSHLVKHWEDKIRPELLLQEERPAFDIHDYGDRIVAALSGVGRRRAFSSIVAGLDNFEACKYLLASLQLANDYTVEVDSLSGLEDSVDSMGLTLLSTDRATDRFKTLGGVHLNP
ncbi:Condensin-2 complex subunit H2 [Nibea albiflora]|uniref:Condensin-2 complex subunit H2 n=1 Tax=Nibea albiflora TaxID=240163 RepID=A0ACB7EUR4_NIBAL|nr:Condensin-2 complex subunit H2 [Nibea albiflora]